KQGYELANEQHSTGPLTHSVFQAALRVARRVTCETRLRQRRVSIPRVAVADFARQIFESFDDKKVLVIGSGEMASETLRYLNEEGARDVTIINRSPEGAARLAASFSARTAPWEGLAEALVQADLVVSATGAEEPIVTMAEYRRIAPRRQQRP